MFLAPNARDNLMTLMRLTREEADDLRDDLFEIDQALAAAEESIAANAAELLGHPPSAQADLCPHREKLRARQMRLFVTRETLAKAGEEVRAKLAAATAELKKVEQLIGIGADPGRGDQRLTGDARAAAFGPVMRRLAS